MSIRIPIELSALYVPWANGHGEVVVQVNGKPVVRLDPTRVDGTDEAIVADTLQDFLVNVSELLAKQGVPGVHVPTMY